MDVRTLEEWDELFRSPTPKQMKLFFSDDTLIENDRIVQESLFLEEALCSDNNLKYGCCEAGCLRIRIVAEPLPPEQYIIDSDGNKIVTATGEIFMDGSDYSLTIDKSFEGLYVRVIMQMDQQESGIIVTDQGEAFITDQGEKYKYRDIPAAHFGYYKVVSDTPTADRVYRDLICYDKMYDILNANVVDWYNSLEFPITIKDMRDSFFEYLGIPQMDVELINDDFEVTGEFKADYDLSGKEVIEPICELNGVFGHINRYGEFEYISLPTEASLEYPYYVNGTSKYEDYETTAISRISFSSDNGDNDFLIGESGNTYYMRDSLVTYTTEESQALETALENLLDLISQFTYRPFEATTYGNPMLQVGTNVTFETRYKPVTSFVMARELSGIQSLKDKFMAKGLRTYPADTNNTTSSVDRAKNTAIQQSNAIVLKVDNNGNMVQAKLGENASKGSYFDINADNIYFKANSTLNMKAAQLNIESDNVAITPNGDLTCVNASIKGTVNADSMLFYNTIRAYSYYQSTPYDWVTHTTDTDSYHLDIRAPYYQNNAPIAIKLIGYDSGEYNGYMGLLRGDWLVGGSLRVTGTKPRLVKTENYGNRLLYAYETASPMFGDLGDGQIAEDGKCYVWLDPIFAETITNNSYQVFLQKCGNGDCWVSERQPNFFVVEGTPGLDFCWELKAKQSDFDQRRMEEETKYMDNLETDYGTTAIDHINEIYREREVI